MSSSVRAKHEEQGESPTRLQPQLNREVATFLSDILPLWDAVRGHERNFTSDDNDDGRTQCHIAKPVAYFGALVASCLAAAPDGGAGSSINGDDDAGATAADAALPQRTPPPWPSMSAIARLLGTCLDFMIECREDGNISFKNGAATDALPRYRVALKAAQWAAGLVFCDADLLAEISPSADGGGGVGGVARVPSLVEACAHVMLRFDAALAPPPSRLLAARSILATWIEIEAVACACNANGSLCILRAGTTVDAMSGTAMTAAATATTKQRNSGSAYAQVQRWCERGIARAEALLSGPVRRLSLEERDAVARSRRALAAAVPVRNNCNTTRAAVNLQQQTQHHYFYAVKGLLLKMRLRLGQAHEGLHALQDAVAAFSECCAAARHAHASSMRQMWAEENYCTTAVSSSDDAASRDSSSAAKGDGEGAAASASAAEQQRTTFLQLCSSLADTAARCAASCKERLAARSSVERAKMAQMFS